MSRLSFCLLLLVLSLESTTFGADWVETFDTYGDGTLLHNIGGWRGWKGNPLDGGIVTSEYARSGPHSLMVLDDTDVVRSFDSYTQGQWRLTGWLYVPSTTVGYAYYNLETRYSEQSTPTAEPGVQVLLDMPTNQVRSDSGPVLPSPTLVRDLWSPLELYFDLDRNYHELSYNGQLASRGTWGIRGTVAFQAIDLYGSGDGGGPVFFDDFSLLAVIAGDTDRDGTVGINDLNNVRNHFGESGTPILGDTNGDNTVDLEDLNAVRNNFGAADGVRAVPEPSTIGLSLLAVTIAVAFRRRGSGTCESTIGSNAIVAACRDSLKRFVASAQGLRGSDLLSKLIAVIQAWTKRGGVFDPLEGTVDTVLVRRMQSPAASTVTNKQIATDRNLKHHATNRLD